MCPKVPIITNSLYSSCTPDEDTVVGAYNTVFSSMGLMSYSNLVMLSTNAGLSRICKYGLGIEKPSFKDYNKVLAQAMSHLL